jgi:hypothetical protein
MGNAGSAHAVATAVGSSIDPNAVLVLAEAICDAQIVLAECYENDLPDPPKALDKVHAILEDQAVIAALKAVGFARE